MRTYLITGGCGFIGSNYIRYLLEKYKNEVNIINLDALTYAGNPENLKEVENRSNYRFIKGSVCDKNLLSSLLCNNEIDAIVHFAAESHVDRSILNPQVFAETNVMGTLALLQAAMEAWSEGEGYKDGKKYLQVSTDEVYGSLSRPEDFFYETTPLNPHSPYSASKASADLMVKAFVDTYRFPAVITRCSNNYGPYQFPEKLIPLMISRALNGQALPVYGDGKNVRDWLYVEDHCKAIEMVLQKGRPGEIYNIGGHNEKTNIEIVHLILKTLRELLPQEDQRREHITEKLITYVEDRKGHDKRYAIAPDKIKKEIGWSPETMFEEGIRMTIAWYLKHGEWIEHLTER